MTYIEIVLLAYALSIDAFAVSFSYGIKNSGKKNSQAIAISTASFQASMPVFGYYLTNYVINYVSPYAKYIVFTIFSILGIKFIAEAYSKKSNIKCSDLGLACVFFIGVGTSIDAFSAGITLLLSGNHIVKPAILIGIITYINSCFGYLIGNKIHSVKSKYLEIAAGLILVALGIKALL